MFQSVSGKKEGFGGFMDTIFSESRCSNRSSLGCHGFLCGTCGTKKHKIKRAEFLSGAEICVVCNKTAQYKGYTCKECFDVHCVKCGKVRKWDIRASVCQKCKKEGKCCVVRPKNYLKLGEDELIDPNEEEGGEEEEGEKEN